MSGIQTMVNCLMLLLRSEGHPLKGQGRPLQLMYQQPVIEEPCVLHPHCVLILLGLIIILHGANLNKYNQPYQITALNASPANSLLFIIVIAMKLTVLRKEKVQPFDELIDLSCKTSLASINPKIHDTRYLIAEVCKRNQLVYSVQLGAICAHVARHYSTDRMKYKYSDLITLERLIQKMGLVFHRKNGAEKETGSFMQFQELVNYGMYCLIITMKADFRDSITNAEAFQERLKKAIRPLLSSLFLEFVPPQYSDLLLKLYLQDYQTEQQRSWMQENKRKYHDIAPYHDFFQILSSLSFHILNHRKVVDCQHYLDILGNPSSGSIEWPVVLCVRNLYKLPALKL